jgi:hypothetical protein
MKKLLSSLALLALLSTPAAAQEQPEHNPLDVAPPPAPTEPVPDWLKYQNPYAGEQTNLANPHRTSEEIAAWVQNMAAEAMSFDAASFNDKLGKLKPGFTTQGWNEYAAWMRDSKIADLVRVSGYNVSTVMSGDAAILNKGTVSGSYHWLLDVPVVISFSRKNPAGAVESVPGGRYRLTMQIGRVAPRPQAGPDAPEDDGITVEGWKVVTME